MPFTPAHTAIVLPLLRSRYFSATGLIVGSVSPDFEYFLKLSVNSSYSHTVVGMFYFDLPIAALIAVVFHQVVKRNLIRNLPGFMQRRLQLLLSFDFLSYLRENYMVFACSALLGAASHLFWDSFTHNNTIMVESLPVYRGTYIPFQGVKYPLFYALQHISSAVGLTIVVAYVGMMHVDKKARTTTPRLLYWLAIVAIAAAVVVIRFTLRYDEQEGNWVVTAMSGLMIASVCCGLINFKNPSIEQEA
jgi:hypothetical protein